MTRFNVAKTFLSQTSLPLRRPKPRAKGSFAQFEVMAIRIRQSFWTLLLCGEDRQWRRPSSTSEGFNKLRTISKALLSLLLIVCAFASSALAQTAPPNIVVILADDLGYGDVGFNGCLDIPTPNIDSMATNGVLCTNGYVTQPFCSPSRAALLTGRYQQRFGYEYQDRQPVHD